MDELTGPDGQLCVKTMDTPHFTSDGEIWYMCEIKLCGFDVVIPFEAAP